MKKLVSWAVVVSLSIIGAAGCGASSTETNAGANNSGQPSSSATYLIGISEPQSGAASSLGTPVVESAKLAVNAINAAGGVNGHKLVLDIRDDKSKPDVDVQNVRALISEGVYGIIGPNQGSSVLAVAPVLDQAKVPTLAFSNTISITNGHPEIFRSQTNDVDNVKAALLFAKQHLHATKIGVVYTNDAYGTDAYKSAVKEAPSLGLTMADTEQVDYNATDTSPEWAKVIASHPDAVLLWGSGSTMATALRNAAQLGNKAPIIGAQGVATHGIIQAAGQAAEGLYLVTLTAPDQITRQQQDLAKLLKAQHGQDYELSPYDTIGWDAVQIYAKALQIANGQKSQMTSALESINNLDLASGTYSFSSTNHDGLGLSSIEIVQVRNGAMHGVQKGFSQ